MLAPFSEHQLAGAALEQPHAQRGLQPCHIFTDCRWRNRQQARSRGEAATLGRLDVLVNNAGVGLMGELNTFTLEDFDRTLAVNVRAVFVGVQAAVRHMGEGGRIVTIGSTNSERMPWAGGAACDQFNRFSDAGIEGDVFVPLAEYPEITWDSVIDINLSGQGIIRASRKMSGRPIFPQPGKKATMSIS